MRIALGVEYDGTDFLGWQSQKQDPTVQSTLERALSFVADAPIRVLCAGRTDTGVHARCQVVHFDTTVVRNPRAWMLGTNSRLPRSVAVVWAQPVEESFHARFSARARRYRYQILNRPVRPALDAGFAAWERLPLNVEAMREAAAALLGEHDFSAFRTVACQAKSPVRTLQAIELTRVDDRVLIEVQANGFLHHMVRNIVGSLLPIGRGEQRPPWIAELLAGRDRNVAGPTAVAAGLTFLGPLYPADCGLAEQVTLR